MSSSSAVVPPLPHLRTALEFRRDGIEFASGSDQFAKLFDAALYQMYGLYNAVEYEGGLAGTIAQMRHADPVSPLPDTLTLYAAYLVKPPAQTLASIVPRLTACLRRGSHAAGSQPSWQQQQHGWTAYETDHVKSALCFARNFDELGRTACEELLARRPRDLLAGFHSFVHENETGRHARRLANIRTLCQACCSPSTTSNVSASASFSSTSSGWGGSNTSAYTAFLLAMEAFGHEEVNELDTAQRLAEEAVHRLAWNPWAHHSLAHIYDARRDATTGLARLTEWQPERAAQQQPDTFLTGHIEWHRGLLHLEREDLHAALAVVDEALWPRLEREHAMLSMSDMTTMLMRMEMMVQQWSGKSDVQKAEFKTEINARWAKLIGYLSRTEFYGGLHGKSNRMETEVVMASLAGKRGELANQLRAVYEQHLEAATDNTGGEAVENDDIKFAREVLLSYQRAEQRNNNEDDLILLAKDAQKYLTKSKSRFIRKWKLDFIDAICAFFDKDYYTCATLLYPHRQHFHKIGGSVAQNEIYAQILAFSLARSNSAQHHARLRKYLVEQSAQREHKNLIEKISANFLVQHIHEANDEAFVCDDRHDRQI